MHNFNKKAYSVQLSYDVTDAEKVDAEKTLIALKYVKKKLEACVDHLDLIYYPFKDNKEVSKDDVWKVRRALRNFRDKSVDNFNQFKIISFKAHNLLNKFSSDPQIVKLQKSFVTCVEDLEKQVNKYISLYDDLSSAEFAQNIVKSVDSIKKEAAKLAQIITDRMEGYIKSNILAKNWIDELSKQVDMDIEEKVPFISKLVELRNKYKKNNDI